MSENYISMVRDYFDTCEALEYKLGNAGYWDTQLITLEVNSHNEELSLTAEQASDYLGISLCKVKSFFVIHCCLSNNLDTLINGREYKSWSVSKSELLVEFPDSISKAYIASEIEQLLKNTETCTWSYGALKNEYDEFV